MKKKEFYFAYFLPEESISGVVRTWEECQSKISGAKKAKHKKFVSHLEAIEYIQQQLILLESADGQDIHAIQKGLKQEETSQTDLDKEAIYFDSGTGRGAGIEISVTNAQGESLLPLLAEDKFFEASLSPWGSYIFPKEKGYTNNFGELFALHCALQLAKKQKICKIFGDSKLVLEYWSLGRMNVAKLSEETVNLIRLVSYERRLFENSGGVVSFIKGQYNPADMGFHK